MGLGMGRVVVGQGLRRRRVFEGDILLFGEGIDVLAKRKGDR